MSKLVREVVSAKRYEELKKEHMSDENDTDGLSIVEALYEVERDESEMTIWDRAVALSGDDRFDHSQSEMSMHLKSDYSALCTKIIVATAPAPSVLLGGNLTKDPDELSRIISRAMYLYVKDAMKNPTHNFIVDVATIIAGEVKREAEKVSGGVGETVRIVKGMDEEMKAELMKTLSPEEKEKLMWLLEMDAKAGTK